MAAFTMWLVWLGGSTGVRLGESRSLRGARSFARRELPAYWDGASIVIADAAGAVCDQYRLKSLSVVPVRPTTIESVVEEKR